MGCSRGPARAPARGARRSRDALARLVLRLVRLADTTHASPLLLSITQAASQRNRVSRVVEAAYCVINREVSFRACVTEVCFCILMMIDARKAISGVS